MIRRYTYGKEDLHEQSCYDLSVALLKICSTVCRSTARAIVSKSTGGGPDLESSPASEESNQEAVRNKTVPGPPLGTR